MAKKNEILIGATYLTKVSGEWVPVVVTGTRERVISGYNIKTVFTVCHKNGGHDLNARTAALLRVTKEVEFALELPKIVEGLVLLHWCGTWCRGAGGLV